MGHGARRFLSHLGHGLCETAAGLCHHVHAQIHAVVTQLVRAIPDAPAACGMAVQWGAQMDAGSAGGRQADDKPVRLGCGDHLSGRRLHGMTWSMEPCMHACMHVPHVSVDFKDLVLVCNQPPWRRCMEAAGRHVGVLRMQRAHGPLRGGRRGFGLWPATHGSPHL